LGYKQSANSGSATSFESNSAVALWDQPYYLIRIDKIPSYVQTTDPASNFGTFIVNSTAAENGQLIEWTQGTNYNQISDININIDQLFVQLFDHEGRLADINDSEWQCALLVDYD
jgi:hypothetical protein